MFAATPRNAQYADYSIIVEPRPEGAVIGTFAGQPISERVVDIFGRHFTYVGVACRRRNGDFDATQLRTGEFIASPGLVYRLVTDTPFRHAA
jgi:hypothetical protein